MTGVPRGPIRERLLGSETTVRTSLGRLALLLSCAAVGCSRGPASPDPIVNPIHIDSVEVFVAGGLPAVVETRVRGVVGDGCSSVHSTTQARAGNTVTVTILGVRPADAICTQIALLYDQRIRLEGLFPQGAYLVKVNDVERSFTVR